MYLVVHISSHDMVVALRRIAARYTIRLMKNNLSNDSYKCTLFIQYLHTIIVRISHHDMVGAALNGDLARIKELTMVVSFRAKGRKKSTFAAKHLQSVIAAVTHHDCVVVAVVIINPIGLVELAMVIALATYCTSRLAWEECSVVDIVAVVIAHVVRIQNKGSK